VNSEELEQSLKTEFESYLKSVVSEMRQETVEFQSRIQAEFDKQKTSFDEAFAQFASRFESEKEFDAAFSSSVSEHLRLARDEGAKITAEAFAEAEELEKRSAPPVAAAKYDDLRDAVNDISSKDSQATILKALVDHAAEFAPRGAFFIIKSEQFTGWRVFGADTHAADDAIRDIKFPVSADTALGSAVRSMTTVDSSTGAHAEDSIFLDDLSFGRPDNMYAIPLIARGKTVAVLYADGGNDGSPTQHEALEMLVRVAGLTVELIASQSARHETQPVAATDFEEPHHIYEPVPAVETFETADEPVASFEPTPAFEPTPTASDFAFSDSGSFASDFQTREAEPIREEVYEPVGEVAFEPERVYDDVVIVEEPVAETEVETVSETQFETVESVTDFVVEPEVEVEPEAAFAPEIIDEPVDAFSPSGSPFESTVEEVAPAVSTNGAYEPAFETVAPPAPVTTTGSRLRDRNVDLPIEVPEEERRSHNDARRFARLLVSEIKLYNEKKVMEGREASDLYPRLREAIDRSREMYDKRVQPPVASKFDYFHYEIVNSLADGDDARLGSGYPGATV